MPTVPSVLPAFPTRSIPPLLPQAPHRPFLSFYMHLHISRHLASSPLYCLISVTHLLAFFSTVYLIPFPLFSSPCRHCFTIMLPPMYTVLLTHSLDGSQ
ncbi:hypothetical protein BDN71DRAFT_530865 [Pleurotus eryngii]|uniref:Uncharacterized protein n=1 Tax=Pleurotus eryngii TaxID=5323 RepID=A0A9P6A4T2_PLEER|nr:hypothetical protein BDN71DRAFT_530865 [Pleurotus eryngii]